ncbi:MAG: LamG domain-containing protein, partial [Verrucomicrobia bacterium]|nr:LamG domain-containing protein [Verrucomicrobiota bacterium]
MDEGSFTLNATASSGLAVSYTSSNTNVATVSGSTVTLRSAGTSTITASQAGNSNWNVAANVPQTLTVQARDSDGDGVTDYRELADGTNPNSNVSYDPINRDLIAYYPLTSDQLVNSGRDESGNGIHGTLGIRGGIYGSDFGVQGSALQFSDKTEPPGLGAVYGTGIELANRSFTVSLWVFRFFPAGGGGWILRTGGVMYGEANPGGSAGTDLHIVADSEKIRFSFFYDDFDLYQPVPIGEWQNLVFVYDKEAAKRRIYVNGSLKAENTPAYGFTGNGNFSFGHQDVSLDEIRFYKKALNSAEVSQLFLVTGSNFVPVITSTNSFQGKVGVSTNWTVTASGSTPITFRGTNAPAGLSVATNGIISGTPTTAGTNSTILTASNAYGL